MNYWIFLFILLSSVGFYNPLGIISVPMEKALLYIAFSVGFVYVFFWQKNSIKSNFPRSWYYIMICGMIISIFTASVFHDQSLFTSFKTTLAFLIPYLCLIIFLRLDVPRDKIMNTLIVLSFISAIAYSANMMSVPEKAAFGRPVEEKDLTRGIVRIAIVYIELFPLLLFYAINKWFDTHKKKWLFYGAFLMVMIFLSVTRQIIFLSAILGLFFLLRNAAFFKKIVIIFIALIFGTIVLPRIPIYKTMLELSQEQKDKNEDDDDVRIKAWEYYTYENQTNDLTPILGNGVPAFGMSQWGKQFDSETENNKLYAVDVGWAGFFYYFGAISTIALLMLFIKGIALKKPKSQQYISYELILIAVTSVASAPILFYYQIVSVCLVFYLAFKVDEPSTVADTTTSPSKEVPKHKGYPQLT